jgi:hypothetical protein
MKDEFIDIFANLEQEIDRIAEENQKIVRSDSEIVELCNDGGWYQIEFSRCDTNRKLVQWVYHLSGKSWVTQRHIRLFLSHVFTRFPELAINEPIA